MWMALPESDYNVSTYPATHTTFLVYLRELRRPSNEVLSTRMTQEL